MVIVSASTGIFKLLTHLSDEPCDKIIWLFSTLQLPDEQDNCKLVVSGSFLANEYNGSGKGDALKYAFNFWNGPGGTLVPVIKFAPPPVILFFYW